MKVLFVSPISPFESIGGIERYIINLINYYKNQTDTEFILILPTKEKSHLVKDQNITTYYSNSLSKSYSQKQIKEKVQVFSALVEEIIIKHKITIICAENIIFGLPGVYSLRLNMVAGLYKIPLVLRLHMYPVSALQIELTNQLMWNKISCVSRSIAGDCFEKGTDINKLTTDYLGVNTKYFNKSIDPNYNLRKRLHLPEDSQIVLTASRIIRGETNILQEKGIINLIQAFSRLSKRHPKLRLVIGVGKATEILKNHFASAYEMLLGYIKIHDIEKTTVVKMFELDEMPNVYRESNLFVLASERHETFGQTFIESMACGVPVIGANTGGIPEIINDSINGYLVPPDNPSILAQKIERLIIDDDTREKFIKAGTQTVEDNFTSDKQTLNFQRMLEATKY